jgi:hypothetical protein
MNSVLVIWICAYLNCAGWFLSAIRQLNAVGYATVLVIGLAALCGWKFFCNRGPKPGRISLHSCRVSRPRRFQRPFPLAFLILSAMALLGGIIHPPNNYDGLAYRLPRVLHWLAVDQWQWIHTVFPRVNNRASGMEWLSAPVLALLKTDWPLFLINFISFLFLPGLVFSVLIRLGVRNRVAWHWMWIVPTGYCFLLQAGSIGNDAFGAPFALAAINFALRAKASKSPGDFFSSILAAALVTGVKTSSLPLLLPWAIAILPSMKIFLQHPSATVAVCVIGCFASFLPNAALNAKYGHDWSGASLESDRPHGNLFFRTGANMVLLGVLNLAPPVFPIADRWNSFVQKTLPPNLKLQLQQTLTEPGAAQFTVPQMQVEENAGLGLGIIGLMAVSLIVAAVQSGKWFFPIRFDSAESLWRTSMVIAPWISALALVSQSEVYPIGRILAPYYALLFPLMLGSPGHAQLMKKCWWHVAAFVVFVMAAGLLVISPARPLFPVGMVLEKIQASHSGSKLMARIEEVYSVYQVRAHAFAPALAALPPDLKILGFISYDDPETSLWQPFGSRRIVYVCPEDSAADLKEEGIQYIICKGEMFGKQFPGQDEWLKKINATVIQKIQLNLRAETGPREWYLVKLN